MARTVLWFRGKGGCRSLCCLGFGGMLVSRVGTLSVFAIVVSSSRFRQLESWKLDVSLTS